MNNEDLTLFRRAERLANRGETLAAYRLFCLIENHSNPEVEVKFWILQTTPSQLEARQLLAWLEQNFPNHHALPRARTFVERRWHKAVIIQPIAPIGPVLTCSYCGTVGPTVSLSRISTIGWVLIVVMVLLSMIWYNLTSFSFWWVGLLFCLAGLLFRQKYFTCSRCSAQLQGSYYQPYQQSYQQGYRPFSSRRLAKPHDSTTLQEDHPSEYEQPQAQYPEPLPPVG
jgi:hypothetical protein